MINIDDYWNYSMLLIISINDYWNYPMLLIMSIDDYWNYPCFCIISDLKIKILVRELEHHCKEVDALKYYLFHMELHWYCVVLEKLAIVFSSIIKCENWWMICLNALLLPIKNVVMISWLSSVHICLCNFPLRFKFWFTIWIFPPDKYLNLHIRLTVYVELGVNFLLSSCIILFYM